jgi:Thioredoxin reductase
LVTSKDEQYQSKIIIISTGLKDILPSIDNISDYYGKSLFSCPYCDGWELRDKPLVIIISKPIQGLLPFSVFRQGLILFLFSF